MQISEAGAMVGDLRRRGGHAADHRGPLALLGPRTAGRRSIHGLEVAVVAGGHVLQHKLEGRDTPTLLFRTVRPRGAAPHPRDARDGRNAVVGTGGPRVLREGRRPARRVRPDRRRRHGRGPAGAVHERLSRAAARVAAQQHNITISDDVGPNPAVLRVFDISTGDLQGAVRCSPLATAGHAVGARRQLARRPDGDRHAARREHGRRLAAAPRDGLAELVDRAWSTPSTAGLHRPRLARFPPLFIAVAAAAAVAGRGGGLGTDVRLRDRYGHAAGEPARPSRTARCIVAPRRRARSRPDVGEGARRNQQLHTSTAGLPALTEPAETIWGASTVEAAGPDGVDGTKTGFESHLDVTSAAPDRGSVRLEPAGPA